MDGWMDKDTRMDGMLSKFISRGRVRHVLILQCQKLTAKYLDQMESEKTACAAHCAALQRVGSPAQQFCYLYI